jgi:hypothetical protein
MSGFLYYVAGETDKPTVAKLHAVGLGHVFDDVTPVEFRRAVRGPDGDAGGGVVVWVKGTLARGGYFPDLQEWRRVPEVLVASSWGEEGTAPAVYIGWERGMRPGPEDLQRGRIAPGHRVLLGDGRRWHVPVARAAVVAAGGVASANVLERRTRLDYERGVWVEDGGGVEYAELWRIAELFWQCLASAGDAMGEEDDVARVSFDERIEYAVRCLRVNYRLGPLEVEVLGLMSEAVAGEVLGAVVDLPRWRQLVTDKKKRALPGSVLSGGAGV